MRHQNQRPVLPGLFMVQIQELPTAPFDGATFQPEQDQARLGAQLQRVLALLQRTACWLTLRDIAIATGDPEASISARLRDLRKQKHGGYEVEHRRRTVGQWEYRINKEQ